MKTPALVLACLCLCAGARAQSTLSLYMSPSDPSLPEEIQLKSWLEDAPHVRAKIRSLAERGQPSDLRDSVAAKVAPAALPAKIAAADPVQKRVLLGLLPGMKSDPLEGCRSLARCPAAPSAFFVEKREFIEDGIAALLRPWMLIQKAHGKRLYMVSAEGSGDRVLNVFLEGLPQAALGVQVSAMPSGGFTVWLHGRPDPAALYLSERSTVLAFAGR